jgi:ABC-type Fe3+ transport system permease subunit
MKSKRKHNENDANQWAEEVMASIDNISRAQANPFLFTRIKSRIDQRYGMWEKIANVVAKPAFAVSSILFFIAINIAVIISGHQKQSEQVAAKSSVDQMLAAEFINTPSYSLVEFNEEK